MNTKTQTYTELSNSIYEIVEAPQRVFFAIYDVLERKTDELGEEYDIISCPDVNSLEPVIKGECKFSINNLEFSTTILTTEIVVDPNWKDILNLCNDLLRQCNVHNTGFLFDIIPLGEGIYEFGLIK